AIVGANASAKVTPATRAEYAEAIAVVASQDGHSGNVYELAGDEAFTMAEFAVEGSRQVSRTVPYAPMPEAAYSDLLRSCGLLEGFALTLADSDARAGEGALFDDSHTLSRLIGRPTTPLATAVAAALASVPA